MSKSEKRNLVSLTKMTEVKRRRTPLFFLPMPEYSTMVRVALKLKKFKFIGSHINLCHLVIPLYWYLYQRHFDTQVSNVHVCDKL